MQRSPDGRWFWDGSAWVPAPPRRIIYEPTVWTRRLQVIILALFAVGLLVVAVEIPTFILPSVHQSIDRSLAQSAGDPNVNADELKRFIQVFVVGALAVAGVGSAVLYAVLVIGVLRLWRWVYWYVVVTYLLGALSLPASIIQSLSPTGLHPPAWTLVASVPALIVEVALAIWMIVLYNRYGTWARRRVET